MKKNLNYIFFPLAFVLIIALGIVFNSLVSNEKVTIKDKKEKEALVLAIKNLLPGLDVDTVEAVEQEFITEGDTKITKRYNGLKDNKVVGIVYFGTTKGWKDGLEVAIGIDTKKNFVIAADIFENNETPSFYAALKASKFFEQFKSKDMNKFVMNVVLVTGPTPNTGTIKELAPNTSAGVEKVMLLSRKQYAKDTGFKMPSGLTIVSKSVDFENINQFIYVFKAEDKNVNVIVNKNYEIISIDDESQRTAASELISKNKMTDYIDSVTTEGNVTTLVIKTAAYSGSTATTTVTITDKVVTNVKITYSVDQSYDDDHNDDYWSGKDSGKNYNKTNEDIKNNTDVYVITGATITGTALRNAQNILRGYMGAHHE